MKEKKRFNFIDVVILLCVALIVTAAIFRAQITEYIASGKNLVEYRVSFETDPTEPIFLEHINVGQKVEWVEKGMVIGEISRRDEAPAPEIVYSIGSNGNLVTFVNEEEKILKGELSINAYEKNGCFVSGTEFIGAGMKMTLRSNNVIFTVTVLEVVKD